MTISDRIASFVVGTRIDRVPGEVVAKAKEQIVFLLGRALEGVRSKEGIEARNLIRKSGTINGQATLIGDHTRCSPSNAAFGNCSLMRGTQRDDVIWPSGIHAGVITLPAALAVGETKHVTGDEFIVAVVAGYEILGKLGGVAQGWEAELPFRPTNIFGAYGPITVASRLLKLDQRSVTHALGYAANLQIGIPEGGMMDHYYSLICRNATFATQLAQAGGKSYSNTTIEGATGLYRSFFARVPGELTDAVDKLGSDWEILRAENKYHPGTGQNTVAVELLLDVVAREKLTADEVTKINVYQPYPNDSMIRKDAVASRGPFKLPVDAYSSLPYALAIVLLEGKLEMKWYDETATYETVNDPTIASVMQKISLAYEAGHESSRYCRLEVHVADGRMIRRTAENYASTLPRSNWGDWLRVNGKDILKNEQLEQIEELLKDLEKLDDVARLLSSMVPRRNAV